jgi:hypothetical protein
MKQNQIGLAKRNRPVILFGTVLLLLLTSIILLSLLVVVAGSFPANVVSFLKAPKWMALAVYFAGYILSVLLASISGQIVGFILKGLTSKRDNELISMHDNELISMRNNELISIDHSELISMREMHRCTMILLADKIIRDTVTSTFVGVSLMLVPASMTANKAFYWIERGEPDVGNAFLICSVVMYVGIFVFACFMLFPILQLIANRINPDRLS